MRERSVGYPIYNVLCFNMGWGPIILYHTMFSYNLPTLFRLGTYKNTSSSQRKRVQNIFHYPTKEFLINVPYCKPRSSDFCTLFQTKLSLKTVQFTAVHTSISSHMAVPSASPSPPPPPSQPPRLRHYFR